MSSESKNGIIFHITRRIIYQSLSEIKLDSNLNCHNVFYKSMSNLFFKMLLEDNEFECFYFKVDFIIFTWISNPFGNVIFQDFLIFCSMWLLFSFHLRYFFSCNLGLCIIVSVELLLITFSYILYHFSLKTMQVVWTILKVSIHHSMKKVSIHSIHSTVKREWNATWIWSHMTKSHWAWAVLSWATKWHGLLLSFTPFFFIALSSLFFTS